MYCGVSDGNITVSDCYNEKDRLKDEFGARWDKDKKVWKLPLTSEYG